MDSVTRCVPFDTVLYVSLACATSPTLREHPSAGWVQDPLTENIHPSKVYLNKTLTFMRSRVLVAMNPKLNNMEKNKANR